MDRQKSQTFVEDCGGYVDVEGQMNSTDFVDDISITFLYVSSSDLVLKNNKY